MAKIKIELDQTRLRVLLHGLIEAGKDLSHITAPVSEKIKAISIRAFKTESDPATGAAWPDLSPVTLAIRKKKGITDEKKLQVSRNLLSSIVADHGKNFATVGTNVPYAAIQNFGGKKGSSGRGKYKTKKGSFPIPWGDIPARPYLGLSVAHERQIHDLVAAKIERILAAQGVKKK